MSRNGSSLLAMKVNCYPLRLFALKVLILILCFLQSAIACQICLPFPEKSLLDKLNAAQSIALARENPDFPNRLAIHELLRGDLSDLNLPLQFGTKRLLDNHPNRAVLCGRIDGEWESLCMYTTEFQPLFNTLIHNEWGEDREQRARFFAPYLSNDSRTLRQLAHLEVARAPYAQIRTLEHSIPKTNLLGFLADPSTVDWHSLYILLLAQMADERDQQGIKQRFEVLAANSITTQLAAWTLAYLETGNEDALNAVVETYFKSNNRTVAELKEIIGALGTYATVEQKGAIISHFSSLLNNQPTLLPEILPWFEEWQTYEVADAVATSLRETSHNIPTTTKAKAFLKKAQQAPLAKTQPETVAQKNSTILYAIAGAFGVLVLLTVVKLFKS